MSLSQHLRAPNATHNYTKTAQTPDISDSDLGDSSRSHGVKTSLFENHREFEPSVGAGIPNGKKPHFFKPSMWLYEILSLVLSAAIFTTIVVVLAVYDGKPSTLR